MKVLLIIALSGLLMGCQTMAERQASLQAADDFKCRSYGVQPGSPPYVQCRMQLDHDRSDREMVSDAVHGPGLIGTLRRAQSQ